MTWQTVLCRQRAENRATAGQHTDKSSSSLRTIQQCTSTGDPPLIRSKTTALVALQKQHPGVLPDNSPAIPFISTSVDLDVDLARLASRFEK